MGGNHIFKPYSNNQENVSAEIIASLFPEKWQQKDSYRYCTSLHPHDQRRWLSFETGETHTQRSNEVNNIH